MATLNDFDNEFAAPVETPAVESETLVEAPASEEIVPRAAHVDEPQSYRREIDLGDGSGKQVFEADTLEALVDKLAEAQTHATKKIREQAQQIRKKPERPGETQSTKEPSGVSRRALTTDEKFALAQKFQNDPDSAFDELYAAKFGRTPDEDAQDREFIRQVRYEREIGAIDNAFLAANPNFHQSQNNAAAMVNFLKSENLPYTRANLEYAFQELTDSGLLEVKPDAASESKSGDSQRISEKPAARSKQMSTGVRTGSVTSRRAPEARQEVESDVQKILAEPDLDKARQLMLKRMAAVKSSR